MPTKEYMRAYREANRERVNAYEREARERNRALIIDEYGGKCSCCGEARLPFLTVEHIGGVVPSSHREKSGKRLAGGALYRVIIREGFPPGLTVLCWNCNMARAHYGSCPCASSGG